MYHAFLWQAGNDNKIRYLLLFREAELYTCHQSNREQEVCNDFSL